MPLPKTVSKQSNRFRRAFRRWLGCPATDRPPSRLPRLHVRQLESRRVLNGDGAVSELVVDAGQGADDGSQDTFEIQQDGDHVVISVNGNTSRHALEGLDKLTIQGSSDNDRFIADLSDGLLAGLQVSIRGASGDDELVLKGRTPVESVDVFLDSPEAGNLTVQAGPSIASLDFAHVEKLHNDLAANELSFRVGLGDDDVRLASAEGDSNHHTLTLTRGSQEDASTSLLVTFADPLQSLELQTAREEGVQADDADEVRLNGFRLTSGASVAVYGDAADTLTFQESTQLSGGNLWASTGSIDVDGSVGTERGTIDLKASLGLDVSTRGFIDNAGGNIFLAGRELQHHGSISAQGGFIELDSGADGVTIVSGLLDVSDARQGYAGGSLRVLGMYVGIVDQATLSASGHSGGGAVLIGGDFQGNNRTVRNSLQTYVGRHTSISADSLQEGNGGTIIIWADEVTRYLGIINARGGRIGGDGGFVEVSGKRQLHFDGSVDVSATAGLTGHLLLDPQDLVISDANGDDNTEIDPMTNDYDVLFGDGAANSTFNIQPSAFEGLNANVTLQATNNITISDAIDLTQSGNVLNIQAGNNLIINASINSLGGSNTIILEADSIHNGGADGAGTLTIANNVQIHSNGGAIALLAADFSIGGGTTSIDAGSGAISLVQSQGSTMVLGNGAAILSQQELAKLTTTGTLTIGQATSGGTDSSGAGAQTVTADNILFNTNFSIGSSVAGSLSLLADNGITLAGDLTTQQDTLVDADTDSDGTGVLEISAGGDELSTSDHVLQIHAGDLNLVGTIDSGTASTTITDSDGSGVRLGGSALATFLSISGAELQNISATGLTLQTAGGIAVDGITAANSSNILGTTTLSADGAIAFAAAASTFNALDAQADNGITVAGDITTVVGNLTLDADGPSNGSGQLQFTANSTLTAAGSLTLAETQSVVLADPGVELTLNAADGITLNDSLTTTAQLTINADTNAGDNVGLLTIASGVTLATTGNVLDITADDINLLGNLNSGAATTTITDSDGTGIRLGGSETATFLNISGAELQNIAATGLTLQTAGGIAVSGITAANSSNILGTTTLSADGAIAFGPSASTFNALDAQADNGITVAGDITTVVGNLSLDADGPSNGSGQLQFTANSTLTAAGSLTLAETQSVVLADPGVELTLNAADGITLNDSLTTTAQLTINADTDAGDNVGLLTIASGVTLATTGNVLDITADDINLLGNLNSGAATTTITDSDGTGIRLGGSETATFLNISGAELQNIAATGLTLQTAGGIAVSGITAANSSNILGTTTLSADGAIAFGPSASTFNALDAQADNGITVAGDITTVVGNLTLDADGPSNGSGQLQFTANSTLTAASNLILAETQSLITADPGVALTLNSTDGITLNDSLTAAGQVTINADTDAGDNVGLLTIASGVTLTTTDSLLNIIASDINLLGNLDSGTAATTITDSDGTGIRLGGVAIANFLNISGAELQNISATGLTLATAGGITVSSISETNSDNIDGILSLIASGPGSTIQFTTGASTFNALSASATDGIVVSSDLSSDTGSIQLNADSDANDNLGTLLVAGTISTSNAALAVTANTLLLLGNLDCGTATTTITDSDGSGIGLGITSILDGLNIAGGDLLNINATNLVLATAGDIQVDDILEIESDGITGTTTLQAGGSITFDSSFSVFNALDAQADNGIFVNVNVTTDTGSLSLDGDANNLVDGVDGIVFGASVTLASADVLNLDATNGNILTAALTTVVLNAADGVNINDSITSSSTGQLIINADTDAGDDVGTFFVASGAVINSSNTVLSITANNLDLQGNLNSGTATTVLSDSDGSGIGLGLTAISGGLNIAGTDLQHITSNGLTLVTPGDMLVDGVSAANSNNITGLAQLIAGGTISFDNNASTFNALSAQADNDILIDTDLTTDLGAMALDGDADNAFDGGDRIHFLSSVNVTSAGSLTLDATTGKITTAVNANVGLLAADGITLNDSMTTTGQLTINADTDANDNDGTFAIAAGASVTTTNLQLDIIANDVALSGSINTGSAAASLTDSDGTGLGLGDATFANGLNISGADLQLISANGLTLSTTGNLAVNGVTAANSNNISGSLSLQATGTNSVVSFFTATSIFNELAVTASDGVFVSANVLTDLGGIQIDADADGNDNSGTLFVASGSALATPNATLDITANDLDLQGIFSSGSAATSITDSDGTGIRLGGSALAGFLNISGAELQRVFANGLLLDTSGSIDVEGISATESDNISSMTTLQAAEMVRFVTTSSTFNALNVLAQDGISIVADINTDTGTLALDGDANNAADGNDRIDFAASVVLSSASDLSLDATTGKMGGGTVNLVFTAADGVTLNDSLAIEGTLGINADTDANDQDGTLTIALGADVQTSNNQVTILANDLELLGSLNSGSAATLLFDVDGTGIGLGAATVANGFNVSGGELQNVSAGDLTLATSGNIFAEGVSAANSNNITGTTQLNAFGSSSVVVFQNTASTFNQLDVVAADGVAIGADLNTDSGTLTIDADSDAGDNSGTLQVSSGVTVSSGNAALEVTANDIALSGMLTSGTAATTLIDSDGTGIGLGVASVLNGLNLEGVELQNISAQGLNLITSGNIWVDGIAAAESDGIGGTTTLQATGSLNFSGGTSTFNALSGLADNGIVISADLVTDSGDLSLDGDADNLVDGSDQVFFANTVTVQSADSLSLDATNGKLVAGLGVEVTLVAADGVQINDSLSTTGNLAIDADSDANDNDGTFTVATGVVISTSNASLQITADNLNLAGQLNSGSGTTTLTDADGTGIGFGDTSVTNGLNLSGLNLESITAGGLTVATGGTILVDGITATNSSGISGLTSLMADGSITLLNSASSFHSLAASAGTDLLFDAVLQTSVGSLTGTAETITVNQALGTPGANISLSARDDLLFNAGSIDSAGGDIALVADADSQSNGSGGRITMSDGTVINAGSGSVTAQADEDITLSQLTSSSGLLTAVHLITTSGGIVDGGDSGGADVVATSGGLTIDAAGGVGTGNPLETQVAFIDIDNTTTGAIRVNSLGATTLVNVNQGSATGDIQFLGTGSVAISGNNPGAAVLTSGSGQISIQATGSSSDVVVASGISSAGGSIQLAADNNVLLVGTTSVTATGGTIQFEVDSDGDAQGTLSLSNQSLLTASGGQVSGAVLSGSIFSGTQTIGDPLSEDNPLATILLNVADPQGDNYVIQVDWDEGNPGGPGAPDDLRAQIVQTIADGNIPQALQHLYEVAPDENDPAADIDVTVRIAALAGDTIQLLTNGESLLADSAFTTTLTIDVLTPLVPFFQFVPESTAGEPDIQIVPPATTLPAAQRQFAITAPQPINNSVGTTVQAAERYYVLRIVSFGDEQETPLVDEETGEEKPLQSLNSEQDEFELSQLPELFKRLPDDRYRLYLIDGQIERLVLDFLIQDGQPAEAQRDATLDGKGEPQPPVFDRMPSWPTPGTESDGAQPQAPAESAGDEPPLSLPEQSQASNAALKSPHFAALEQLGKSPALSVGGVVLSAGMLTTRKQSRQTSWASPDHKREPGRRPQR